MRPRHARLGVCLELPLDSWKDFSKGNHVEVLHDLYRGEFGRITGITAAHNLHFIHVELSDGGNVPFRPAQLRPLNALEELAFIADREDG